MGKTDFFFYFHNADDCSMISIITYIDCLFCAVICLKNEMYYTPVELDVYLASIRLIQCSHMTAACNEESVVQ